MDHGETRPARAKPDRTDATWRAAFTHWPGSGEPLLLAARSTLAPPAEPGAAGHLDAWYCRDALGLAPADHRAEIPRLSALQLYLAAETARLCVAGRTWLAFPGPPHGWHGPLPGHCLFAAYFTDARSPAAPSMRRYRAANSRSAALIGEIAVRCYPGVWRAEAFPWP